MAYITQWVLIVSAVAVAWCAICAVNRMTTKTRLAVRLSYVLLGAGALGAALQPLWLGYPLDLIDALFILGFVGLAIGDKRRTWT